MPALTVTPLTGDFGVEIDADLSGALSPEQQAELYQLFNQHGLLVFRGQDCTLQHQIRAMSYLKRGRYLERDPDYVKNEGTGVFVGTDPLDLHSDSAFLPEPISAVSLFAEDVVDGRSATKFSSGKETYRRLPSELQERIDSLYTLHVMPVAAYARNRARDVPTHYPRTARRLVHRHAATGEPVIYVSWVMIDGLIGVPEAESDAILDELKGYLTDPAHIYEHRWNNGDLVIWDNVMLLHARDDTADAGRRILRRASVGAYHTSDLYPEFPPYVNPQDAKR